jgi:Tfp pilus assembly protein PilF
MRRFILITLILFILSPVFAENKDNQENIPTFTNKDLEKYYDEPVNESESFKQIREENGIPPATRPLDAGTIFRENNLAVVAIIAYDDEGHSFGHGSGFIVTQDGGIVTSYHVISNAAYAKVRTGDRFLNVEGLLYKDEENDIAILKTDGKNLQTVKLGDIDKAEIGEKVFVMSSPKGRENVISEGILNGIRKFGHRKRILQITAAFSVGSSGGPVFNKSGKVIGIATFIISGDVKNIHFAVPISHIKDKISDKNITVIRDALSEDYRLSAVYWLNVANDFNKSGRYTDALKAYKKAIKINRDLSSAYNGLGTTYMKLNKYKEAAEVYKQALRLEPDSAWVHSNLGLAYTETSMYKEAIYELKKAIRIMPDLAVAHFNLGFTYRRLKMYKDASKAYKQAVRINPDFADAHYALGITYFDLKDKDSAEEEHKILKDLDPALADKLFNRINR